MNAESTLYFLEQFCNQIIEDLNEGRNLHFNKIGLTRLIDLLTPIERDLEAQPAIKSAFSELQCVLIEIRKQIAHITDN